MRSDEQAEVPRIGRRTLIKGAAVTAGAIGSSVVLGGYSSTAASGSAVTTGATDRQWRQLAKSLHGTLVRPGDPLYPKVAPPFDLRYANVHPKAVVLAKDTADVQTTLRFARDQGIRPVARSGGHSYGGYSTGPGIVVSLAAMKTIGLDAATGLITVQPGVRNENVKATLPSTGLALPAGRCPTVGVGGFLLGGGFGFNSRKLGTASDNMVSTEVVLADGEVVTASASSEPDLFWGCRGGGGGNFGINTSFELQGHPISKLAVYQLTWDREQAAAAFMAMQRCVQAAPDGFSCRIGLDISGTPPNAELSVTALGQLWGTEAELAHLLAPVITATRPSKQTVQAVSYAAALDFLEAEVPVGQFTERSGYLPVTPEPDIAAFVATAESWLQRWPGSTNNTAVGLAMFAWGGAINRVPPGATAFVHRDASWLFAIGASWGKADRPSIVAANLDWLGHMYGALVPFSDGQAYQNFIDPALSDWRSAYYGENYARLTSVKRQYDPDDVFEFAQGIPPAA